MVSREALFERVWPDTMPTDDVLTQAVAQLRKAFADDRDAPRYIETISKGGYRLLADVDWLDAGNVLVAPDETGEGGEADPGTDANRAATSDEWEGTEPPPPGRAGLWIQIGHEPADLRRRQLPLDHRPVGTNTAPGHHRVPML